MNKVLFAGLIAGSLLIAAGAASAPLAQIASPRHASGQTLARKDASEATKSFRAVLRYGPGTTSACQSVSENSSAICLLLALHVIRLSQKPVSETLL